MRQHYCPRARFRREAVLREKHDARECDANVEGRIDFGYSTTETGFGWTNSVMLEFLERFPPDSGATC